MNSLREWEEAFEQAVDVKKSYDLAKRMEGPKTNPVLGYRTAGSKAEWETGEPVSYTHLIQVHMSRNDLIIRTYNTY